MPLKIARPRRRQDGPDRGRHVGHDVDRKPVARLQANCKKFVRALLVSSDLQSLIDRSPIDDLIVEALRPYSTARAHGRH
jgi:hypothetical protein